MKKKILFYSINKKGFLENKDENLNNGINK